MAIPQPQLVPNTLTRRFQHPRPPSHRFPQPQQIRRRQGIGRCAFEFGKQVHQRVEHLGTVVHPQVRIANHQRMVEIARRELVAEQGFVLVGRIACCTNGPRPVRLAFEVPQQLVVQQKHVPQMEQEILQTIAIRRTDDTTQFQIHFPCFLLGERLDHCDEFVQKRRIPQRVEVMVVLDQLFRHTRDEVLFVVTQVFEPIATRDLFDGLQSFATQAAAEGIEVIALMEGGCRWIGRHRVGTTLSIVIQ